MRALKNRAQVGCDCCDPGCPVHPGESSCNRLARVVLRRVDFDDQPECNFCQRCAEDAMESGVFD